MYSQEQCEEWVAFCKVNPKIGQCSTITPSKEVDGSKNVEDETTSTFLTQSGASMNGWDMTLMMLSTLAFTLVF